MTLLFHDSKPLASMTDSQLLNFQAGSFERVESWFLVP